MSQMHVFIPHLCVSEDHSVIGKIQSFLVQNGKLGSVGKGFISFEDERSTQIN